MLERRADVGGRNGKEPAETTAMKELDLPTMFFDDLVLGAAFKTPGRTITESDIVAFAGLSGDYNALHTDAEFSREASFGQRIAHGLLVLAITSGLTARLTLMKAMEGTILGLVNLECSWVRPTFIGDTIHVVVTIAELKEINSPGRGIVVLERTAHNQRNEELMRSRWKLLVRRARPYSLERNDEGSPEGSGSGEGEIIT